MANIPTDQDIEVAQYERWIARYDQISEGDIEAIRDLISALPDGPLISVLLRVGNPSTAHLEEAIRSVLTQAYTRWELCIAYDASSAANVRFLLEASAAAEARVKLVRAGGRGMACTSNAALELASGAWALLLGDTHRLRPHSLYMVAEELSLHPDAEFVYSDEDAIDDLDRRSAPYFKPDWDPLLLLGQNFVGHLSAFRRQRAIDAGGFRPEFDGSHDLDLFLRILSDVPDARVRHIRHVLYHTRGDRSSLQSDPPQSADAKDNPARRAVHVHLSARGEQADVVDVHNGCLSIRFFVSDPPPVVEVIVPTTAKPHVAAPCLEDLLTRTSYRALRVLLVCSDQDTQRPDRAAFLDDVASDNRVTLLVHRERPFSWAWSNNFAYRHSRASVLCFLNDDTSTIDASWLESMVAHVLRDQVGAVGPKLFYPDDTIQHGGVIVGSFGLAAHRYVGLSRGAAGPNGRALVSQEVSAVTGACMVVRREAFESVGGFDERLKIAFNDIDFCLRLRQAGWRIIWTPDSQLYHRESISIGMHYAPERRAEYDAECDMFRQRWSRELLTDPFHNPNLALDDLGRLAFPPRERYPWLAGAPLEVSLRY